MRRLLEIREHVITLKLVNQTVNQEIEIEIRAVSPHHLEICAQVKIRAKLKNQL